MLAAAASWALGAVLEMADDDSQIVFSTDPAYKATLSASCVKPPAVVTHMSPPGAVVNLKATSEEYGKNSYQDELWVMPDIVFELGNVPPTCVNKNPFTEPCIPHTSVIPPLFTCKLTGAGGEIELPSRGFTETIFTAEMPNKQAGNARDIRRGYATKVNCSKPSFEAIVAATGFDGQTPGSKLEVSLWYGLNESHPIELEFKGRFGTNSLEFVGWETPPLAPPPSPAPSMPGMLYEMPKSFTFTTCMAEGSRTGATKEQCRAWYEGGDDWLMSDKYVQFAHPYPGFYTWTVPKNGVYRIEAVGAQGGCTVGCGMAGRWGSPGAKIVGNFIFNISQKIIIAPGHGGGNGHGTPNWNEAGGGGGSYVFEYGSTSDILNSDNNDDPIIIAGGGGSAPPYNYGNGNCGSPDRGVGQAGRNGAVGDKCGTDTLPGEVFGGDGGHTNGGSYVGGAGGGWTSNGKNGNAHCGNSGSMPSCMGGGSVKTDKKLVGGQGNCYYVSTNYGGFGGGGGGCYGSGGAGGGYNGGNAMGSYSSYNSWAGGGGSYNSGFDQKNIAGGGYARAGGNMPAEGWNKRDSYLTGENGWVKISLVA